MERIEGISFEESLTRLEKTVRLLEQGGLTVDESVQLFEEGTRLVRLCNALLDQAEMRINRLTQSGEDDYQKVPFEDD